MKRDARIGLAVVLVLGLAVTLLIGRAIFKNSEHVASLDNEGAANSSDSSASASGEVRRVDGVESSAVAAAAAAPVNGGAADSTKAVKPADGSMPAVDKFLADQTSKPTVSSQPVAMPVSFSAPPASTGIALNGSGKTNTLPDEGRDHEAVAPIIPVPAPAPESADTYGYVVVQGDNVWKISSKVFGDGKYTQKIIEANGGLNSDKMKVGSVIKIPAIAHKTMLMKLQGYADACKSAKENTAIADSHKPAKSADTSKALVPTSAPRHAEGAAAEQTTHKVTAGETLASIAKKYYGVSGPKTQAKILAANKGLNPDKIKVGTELVIPAK